MTKKHSYTIQEHVNSNVELAIDQADAYGGLEQAFHSCLQNLSDSVLEDGYEDTLGAIGLFCSEFQKKTGKIW
jgi:hypothetical protein